MAVNHQGISDVYVTTHIRCAIYVVHMFFIYLAMLYNIYRRRLSLGLRIDTAAIPKSSGANIIL